MDGSRLAAQRTASDCVTLTGPGGSGKTRLAIEAAAELVPEFKAGVFWVGLASLRDPALVYRDDLADPRRHKRPLRAHRTNGRCSLLARQPRAGDRRRARARELLTRLPQPRRCSSRAASCCVSRERSSTQCPPLADPRSGRPLLRSALALDVRTHTIAELCERLDNLPLAVELAAARTNALSPRRRSSTGSRSGSTCSRAAETPRPASRRCGPRSSGSYELLYTEEQELFAHLSVFAFGCTVRGRRGSRRS